MARKAKPYQSSYEDLRVRAALIANSYEQTTCQFHTLNQQRQNKL